jgi:hypothetical protein
VKLGLLRFIFKGQLSILLRLLEFVRNRELSKLSNEAIAESPHAPLGALLSRCAPLASRASVAHLRCALRDLTWVTLSQVMSPVCSLCVHYVFVTRFARLLSELPLSASAYYSIVSMLNELNPEPYSPCQCCQ